MQKRLQFSILTLLGVTLATALLTGWLTNKPLGEGMGRVVLIVTDVDSGEPIPNVTFVTENVWAEIWASPVGKSDSNGRVRFESKEQKGFEYYISPVPNGYEETGDGDGRIPTAIRPGETVVHKFYLRNSRSPDNK